MPDHDHRVGPQDRDVVGGGLGVRRPHPDVDQRDAVAVLGGVVVGGHLDVVVGPHRVGVALEERLDVHRVVGEQHVALEGLGGRPGVVAQPVDREPHALGGEEEELLRAGVHPVLVERVEEGRVVEREGRAGRADGDPGPRPQQRRELAAQVAADRAGAGELAGQARVHLRPGPHHLDRRVPAVVVDRREGVDEARDRGVELGAGEGGAVGARGGLRLRGGHAPDRPSLPDEAARGFARQGSTVSVVGGIVSPTTITPSWRSPR